MSTPTLERSTLLEQGRAAAEAQKWDEAFAAYEAALRDRELAAEAPEILRRIGSIHFRRGDFEVAGEILEASQASALAFGNMAAYASATNFLAAVRQSCGHIEDAEALYCEAQAAAEGAGHLRLAAVIDQNLATLATIRGDLQEAIRRYSKALDRFEKASDDEAMLAVLNNMGMAHVDAGDWSEAERCLSRALTLAERGGEGDTLATVQLNRAELYLRRHRLDDARACVDTAFELFGRTESKYGLGETYKLYGVLYREAGKLNLASAHLSVVAELAAANEYLLLEAEAEAEHALVQLAQGHNVDALRSLNRAHHLFNELKARRELLSIERELDRLEASYLQVVQVWGESIESKDAYTAGHCARVAAYTSALAAAAGFAGRDLNWIRMGAFLHDVGKTTVRAEVLNKPGNLTAEEWEEIKAHTTAGHAIVAELGFAWDIAPIVRSHHERWDGSGYPDGLSGEEIPLIARILCVADVYDALTTTRSYRPAFDRERALQIMEEDSGRIFDPRLFPLFQDLIRSGAFDRPPPAGA